MAISEAGRRRRELQNLLKAAETDFRRYIREAAKHEIKRMSAERMKEVCRVSIKDFARQLAELGD